MKFAVICVKRPGYFGTERSISSKITLTKEKARLEKKKEQRGRKEEKRKKAMLALLVITIMATLGTVFGRNKTLLDGKDPFGSNVFKNPGRFTTSVIFSVL